ncbi:type IV secretory system conjugative DNA transfer family protein [Dactylosporangium sp. CS-047395]|uniref:type IV secretory system conjugative DNA transfer family protein n=1 Tax=Dactylosporangium sp. CS-047395 TaxID=3239936 RepID=UPI003D8C7A7C
MPDNDPFYDPITIAWKLTKMSTRAMVTGFRLAGRAASGGRNLYQRGRVAGQLNASRAAMATGVLMPGDPPPAPSGHAFLDYRGIAGEAEARALPPGGFPLGRLVSDRRGPSTPVAVPFEVLRRHAAVIGPNGSGKTRGVVLPWIYAALKAGHTVLAVDVKGDLLDDVGRYAAAHGRLGVKIGKWDLSDPAGSVRWNWLDELVDDGSLDAAVVAVIGRENKQSSADPYFYRRDAALLRGLLQLRPLLGVRKPTVADFLRLLTDHARLHALLRRNPAHPGANEVLTAIGGLEPDEHTRAVSGVATALARLTGAGLTALGDTSARGQGLSMSGFLDSGALLVVTAPLSHGEPAKVASALALNLIVQRLYGRFGRTARQVFLVIDEAPRIVDRFAFEEVLSVSRSASTSVVVAAQDVAQFKDANERSAIFGNCATLVSLAGASPATAELVRQRLGTHTVPVIATGTASQSAGGMSLNRSMVSAPVLGDREITQPPFGPRGAIAHIAALDRGITNKPLVVDLTDN